jgi:hypothetical protein
MNTRRTRTSGWLGEQQCVRFSVLAPAVSWHEEASPSQVVSYVGCTSRIVVRAQDCSRSPAPACSGMYQVYIGPLSLPQRAEVMCMLPCQCMSECSS